MSEATTTRRRGGGGAARRAARSAVSFESARFIERSVPNFEVFNDEAIGSYPEGPRAEPVQDRAIELYAKSPQSGACS